MAECQVPYNYTDAAFAELESCISKNRFQTYLQQAGHDRYYAIELYLYNARLAKSFLFPLQIVEVTFRNAIDSILIGMHGPNWHQDDSFRTDVLTAESLLALDKAIDRAGKNPIHGKVIAELTFDFWSNLFRDEYDRTIWQTKLHNMLPNMPTVKNRSDIQSLVREINHFRNRIAHHEPIFKENITKVYSQIIRLIDYRSNDTATWVKSHSTVSSSIRTKPKKGRKINDVLARKCDPRIETVNTQTSIANALSCVSVKKPAIVCLNNLNFPEATITASELIQYIHDKSSEQDGMIDLNEHSIQDLLSHLDIEDDMIVMPENTHIAEAITQLQKQEVKAVVAIDQSSQSYTGAIIKAHRRY